MVITGNFHLSPGYVLSHCDSGNIVVVTSASQPKECGLDPRLDSCIGCFELAQPLCKLKHPVLLSALLFLTVWME